MFLRTVLAAAIVLAASLAPLRAEIRSYALVQDDASLRVQGKTIRLAGIYIPETERVCRSFIRPVRCAERAVQALAFRIQGFVSCVEHSRNPDGSLNATCYVDRSYHDEGEDLGAYLIKQGWAVARPGAPFEYGVLEKIAREHKRGIWGFSVDAIQ